MIATTPTKMNLASYQRRFWPTHETLPPELLAAKRWLLDRERSSTSVQTLMRRST